MSRNGGEPGVSRETIYVVEDELVVGLDIQMHLRRLGYRAPKLFGAAEDLLASFPAEEPDLVIMDIRLRGTMDGLTAARRVRQEYGIPIVLLTAYADEATITRAKESDPFAYIIKPFDERDLRTAVTIAFQRRDLEKRLRDREELFRTTIESIREAVLVTTSDGRIRFMNGSAELLLGVDRERAKGSRRDEIVHLEQSRDATDSGRAIEYLARPDGTRVPVECTESVSPPDRHGENRRIVVFRDLSATVENERRIRDHQERLRHAQRLEAVGKLTAGVAHDFNNLLTVINGYARLLADHLLDVGLGVDESIQADIRGIHDAIRRAVGLTQQLLAFGRQQNFNLETVSLNELLRSEVDVMKHLVDEDVVLVFRGLARNDTVRVDRAQLQRAVLNLVSNARDASEKGASVLIETDNTTADEAVQTADSMMEPGDYVTIRVEDHGAGMDDETRRRSCEPFFTTKGPAAGSGLGLSTAYGVARQLGGGLVVRSALGIGTTVTIYLPQVSGPSHESLPGGGSQPGELPHVGDRPRGRSASVDATLLADVSANERVLLVSEDVEERTLMRRLLDRSGYAVVESHGAGDALLMFEFEKMRPQVAVVAATLRYLSGAGLVTRLRRIVPSLRGVVIGNGCDDGADTGDGTACVGTPFSPEEFLRAVRNAFDAASAD